METTIGVRGDSITMGARDTKEGGWVIRLQNYLGNIFLQNDKHYGLAYNLGISGDTSSSLLKRFELECKARQPNVIIFAIGSNDCTIINNKENFVPLNIFQKNIGILHQMAKKFTNKIIFVGLTICDETKTVPIPRAPKLSQDMKTTLIYNNTIKDFCKQEDIYFIDIINILDTQDLEDGIHPTVKGHEKMYIRIRDFLIDKKIISN